MENRRTLILAAVLGVLVGGVLAVKGLNKFILDPTRRRRGELNSLESKIKEEQRKADHIVQSNKMMRDVTARSLPPNVVDAQRLYKEWVHDLADVAGFDSLVVEPGRSIERQTIGQGRLRKPLFGSVPVNIEGKTTLDRLCRFLYYFHRANLPHRISDLKLTSNANEGNPKLKVRMTVEALALADAKPRSRIFPETKLANPLGGLDDKVQVAAAPAGFPKAGGFQVRIGRNVATVTARNGKQWTVRPGIDPPPNGDADSLNTVDAGKSVELLPVTANPLRTFADYRRDLFARGKSPFVLPIPLVIYSPRLDIPLSQRVLRGDTLSFRARGRDLNPDKGPPRFALGKNAPKGMTIDAKTGEVRWKPTDKDRSKTYPVEIAMRQGTSEKPLKTGVVDVILRDPNVPPTLQVVTKHSGFLGTAIEFVAKATDPDGFGPRFSLSRAPGGAEIGSRSGVFRWTPGDDLEPGDYDFDVVVTDSAGDSVRKTVTISLQQNAEKFTKLIAIIGDDGKREAWLYDISTKERKIVHEAEPFAAAGISGFVYVIGRDFLEFQAGKKSYRLPLGSFLSERQQLKAKPAGGSKSGKSSVASAGKSE